MSKSIRGDARNMDLSQFAPGGYPIIVADPPWWYADQKKVRKDTKTPTRGIGACHHHDLLKNDVLCAMPVKALRADRSLLFLWATGPKLLEAAAVMDAWGFTFSTMAFNWVKLNPGIAGRSLQWLSNALRRQCGTLIEFLDKLRVYGTGYYTASNCEIVMVGRRSKEPGKTQPKSIRHGEFKGSQIVFAPRDEYSKKPEEVQRRLMAMYPEATPRLELFARRPLEGWTVWGNEVGEEKNGCE